MKKIQEKYYKFIQSKRILNNLLPHNFLLFIFMILSGIILVFTFINNNSNVIYNQDNISGLSDPLLVEPQIISFDNVTLNQKPDKICLDFATYNRVNQSSFKFEIYKNEEIISEINFNAKNLKDGKYYCFDFANSIDENNIKDYYAKITPIYSDSDNAIALYKNSETNEIAMKFINRKNITFFMISTVIFCVCFFIINYLINKNIIQLHHYWLLIAIVYIIPLALTIPPYQMPDDTYHFLNSYKLSQFNLIINNNANNKTIYVPKSLKCLNYSKVQIDDKVTNVNDIIECSKEAENDWMYEKKISPSFRITYIVHAIGIKLFDLFSNSILLIYYGGRLFITMFSIMFIYFVIKKIPKYKEIVLFVVSIPMFINQFISYSYDGIVNNLCLLIFALIINLIYNKKSHLYLSLFIILLAASIIANIKFIYLAILLLLLFVPNEKFKNKKLKYIYTFLIIILSYIIGQKILSLIGSNFNLDVLTNIKSNNYDYLISNPLKVFPIIFNTIIFKGWEIITGIYGSFGWMIYHLNSIMIIGYILITIYVINSFTGIKTDKVNKVILLIGILLAIASIFGSMYIYWSEDQSIFVEGVQGRYFLPLILSIIILLIPKKAKFKFDKNILYTFINIILFHTLLFLIMCYY